MLPDVRASLAVQHAGSYRVVAAGRTATMAERAANASELRCGFVLELTQLPYLGRSSVHPAPTLECGQ